MSQEIAVHQIRLLASEAYLLVGPAGLALVDCGAFLDAPLIRARLRALGHTLDDLRLILLTHVHYDHAAGLLALRPNGRLCLAAHPLAEERLCGRHPPVPPAHKLAGRLRLGPFRPFLPHLPFPDLPVDLPLEDGADLSPYGLPATVLHTPGHTPESLTLLLDDGRAFVGDLLVERWGRLVPQPSYIEDEAAFRSSLEHLREHRPRLIYSGHARRPHPPPWEEIGRTTGRPFR